MFRKLLRVLLALAFAVPIFAQDDASVALGPKLGLLATANAHATTLDHTRALFQGLDQIVQGQAKSIILGTPPASPSSGDAYILQPGTSPTGAWSGHAGSIAYWNALYQTPGTNTYAPQWVFLTPKAGWVFWVQDVPAQSYTFDGTAWNSSFNSNITYVFTAPEKWHLDGDATGGGGVLNDAVRFQPLTQATSGTQAIWSPNLRFSASAWNSGSSLSQEAEWDWALVPVPNGTASPGAYLRTSVGFTSASPTELSRFYNSGGFTLGGTSDPGAGVFNANTGFRVANAATTGNYLRGNGTNFVSSAIQAGDLPAGTGTVTSVALSLPATFSVSGSPVTTSGTLSASYATQTANTLFAGPTSGGASTPAFRALVTADIATPLTTPGPIGSTTASTATFTTINGTDTTVSSSATTGAETLAGSLAVNASTTSNSSGLAGTFSLLAANPATPGSQTYFGSFSQVNFNATSGTYTGSIEGVHGKGFLNATGGTYTGATAIGLRATAGNSAAGTLGAADGIFVDSITNTGGGAVTTAQGIVVSDITAGSTNNRAIKTGLGLVLLGDTTDSTTLTSGGVQASGGLAVAKSESVGGNVNIISANGGQWIAGQSSELLTLSTSGTTTDTTGNLLPANSVIRAVVARVTTTITTATNWELGDATTAGRFSAPNSTMTAGTTQVGLVHIDQTGSAGPRQTSAAKVRVTTTGTPGAGVIRITVFYDQFVAPTS